VCDRLGVSSLAFRLRRFVPIAVSFRCRHTVVAVDPSLILLNLELKLLLSPHAIVYVAQIRFVFSQ